MKTKTFYVGYSFSERKVRKYTSEQLAKEDAVDYMTIEAGDYKEARTIYEESRQMENESSIDYYNQ